MTFLSSLPAAKKRQLAPSPFASPVLKHPCTVRDDQTTPHATPTPQSKSPASLRSSMAGISSLGVSSLTEVTEDESLAQPLCLADLCTQTSDLTSVTATTCTGYFNELCLEDSERELMGTSSGTELNRPHPLHSTAHVAHLGSTQLTNWHETPVPFSTGNGNQTRPRISGASGIHVSVSSNQYSGLDSGVGGSAELNHPTSVLLSDNQGSGSHSSDVDTSGKAKSCVVPETAAVNSCNSWRAAGNTAKQGSILTTIYEGLPSAPHPGMPKCRAGAVQ